jgi:hypothetical protein
MSNEVPVQGALPLLGATYATARRYHFTIIGERGRVESCARDILEPVPTRTGFYPPTITYDREIVAHRCWGQQTK